MITLNKSLIAAKGSLKSGTFYADDYWSTGKMALKLRFINGLLVEASYSEPPANRP
jgi:hypothetical protein